ncbi:MAG: hypothetical protein HYR64_08705 [Fimbriimonas ginsengisoli]|uniref:Exonuclease VII large subunit C-terminal domain-containing protein n=1 Tax=Fimbriimonas ginsengisoli TaxID=1005039 RepID=A0A931PWC2_FIMGI|nr:hypothetical protein [Fimbriimonas ginsengisoli]
MPSVIPVGGGGLSPPRPIPGTLISLPICVRRHHRRLPSWWRLRAADILERIGRARAKSLQAPNLLHRRVGRGLQRIDEIEYRMRERVRAAIDGGSGRGARSKLGCGDSICARAWRRIGGAWRRRITSRCKPCGRGCCGSAAGSISLSPSWDSSPLLVLERGYAIVTNARGVVRDSASAPRDSRIHVRLAKGELDATVR